MYHEIDDEIENMFDMQLVEFDKQKYIYNDEYRFMLHTI